MKKNAFVRFITVTHTITSLRLIIPQSLWLAIWNWLLERLSRMHHGRGLQKFLREVRFFSDASEQIWIWLWMRSISLGLFRSIRFLIMNTNIIWTNRDMMEVKHLIIINNRYYFDIDPSLMSPVINHITLNVWCVVFSCWRRNRLRVKLSRIFQYQYVISLLLVK